MSVERDQLADKLIEAHHLDKKIESNGVLKAFKDGVTDGLIYGERDEKQESYYYKQGYDFGLTLYGKLNKYLEDNNIRVSKNNEKE
tara:strand:- start:4876 stop:5133 length:258 start_codon:yes stop_codon:yes gene_type:complete